MTRASSGATERASTAISHGVSRRLERMPWAKTAIHCGIITGIGVDDEGLPPGGQMSDSTDAWHLTLKRLRREQNAAEAAVARKTQEHQATADAWSDPRSRPWRSTSTTAVTR